MGTVAFVSTPLPAVESNETQGRIEFLYIHMSIEHIYSCLTYVYLSTTDLNPFLYTHEEFVCIYIWIYTNVFK